MTQRIPMRHMIVLLPGIMGSVLQKDGRDIWSLSGQALAPFLLTQGDNLRKLVVAQDDWQRPSLDDGVRAVRLFETVYNVPGLIDGVGYATVCGQLKARFELTEGSILDPDPAANFFPFPYDWRRDCRASALALKRFIDQQLPRWRERAGQDAKVILLGHSMGGLVSRYYMEVLGGWEHCLALITFGTPHRGAPNALRTVSWGFGAKGLKKLLLGGSFDVLTEIARSSAAVYQLLPIYPSVLVNGAWKRVCELDNIPNVDRRRATEAREQFHSVIFDAVSRNLSTPGYTYRTLPVIGTHQRTYQSAVLEGGALNLSLDPPAGLDRRRAYGDGTVPGLSALPPELDVPERRLQQRQFISETHGWLTNNQALLASLFDQIADLVSDTAGSLCGGDQGERPELRLDVDQLYLEGEEVLLEVAGELPGGAGDPRPLDLAVTVRRVDQEAPPIQRAVKTGALAAPVGVSLGELPPGLYQVQAQSAAPGLAPMSIGGAFEVVAAGL